MAEFRIAPGREGQFNGVAPTLIAILKTAAANAPPNVSVVEAFSGKAARGTGTTNHPNGKAVDVRLIDTNGNALPNSPEDAKRRGVPLAPAFRTYEQFAQAAKAAQEQIAPNSPFRWGGYFVQGVPFDLMHFDVTSNTMAGGTWKGGLTADRARVLTAFNDIPPTSVGMGAPGGVPPRLASNVPLPNLRPAEPYAVVRQRLTDMADAARAANRAPGSVPSFNSAQMAFAGPNPPPPAQQAIASLTATGQAGSGSGATLNAKFPSLTPSPSASGAEFPFRFPQAHVAASDTPLPNLRPRGFDSRNVLEAYRTGGEPAVRNMVIASSVRPGGTAEQTNKIIQENAKKAEAWVTADVASSKLQAGSLTAGAAIQSAAADAGASLGKTFSSWFGGDSKPPPGGASISAPDVYSGFTPPPQSRPATFIPNDPSDRFVAPTTPFKSPPAMTVPPYYSATSVNPAAPSYYSMATGTQRSPANLSVTGSAGSGSGANVNLGRVSMIAPQAPRAPTIAPQNYGSQSYYDMATGNQRSDGVMNGATLPPMTVRKAAPTGPGVQRVQLPQLDIPTLRRAVSNIAGTYANPAMQQRTAPGGFAGLMSNMGPSYQNSLSAPVQTRNLPPSGAVQSAQTQSGPNGDQIRSYVMNGVTHTTLERNGTTYVVR